MAGLINAYTVSKDDSDQMTSFLYTATRNYTGVDPINPAAGFSWDNAKLGLLPLVSGAIVSRVATKAKLNRGIPSWLPIKL